MFKPGDIVRLRSGGPTMTVEQVGIDMLSRERVWVNWFTSDGELKHATFPQEALEYCEGETKPEQQ